MSLTLTFGIEPPALTLSFAKLKPWPRSTCCAAGLLPGRHAALDVPSRSETLVLGRLHRHGRSLAEGAIEEDRLARPRELVDESALADIVLKLAIGRVKRTGNGARALA